MKTLSGDPFDFNEPWVVEQPEGMWQEQNAPALPSEPKRERREMCCDKGHWNEANGICCPDHYPNTCGYHG